jgi:hypothetical protein
MPSQLSENIETRQDLAERLLWADRILMPMLQEHSQGARALWDLGRDERGRDVLTLALKDPWGAAASDFAFDELQNENLLRQRFYKLIGDMIMPSHPQEARVRVELLDAFVTTDQLEELRRRLGAIPDVHSAQLRLHNQVRFLPERPDQYFVTDFAIEVNAPFEQAVRSVVERCGFRMRNDPCLIHREGVRKSLQTLVDQHRRDGEPSPDFALCFQLQDRDTIHLLEVSRQAPELEDGSLEGVGFSARGVVAHAQTLKIYLVHPNDLRAAFRVERTHPLFHDLRNGNCEFLFPDDGGAAFRRAFADLLEA